MTRSITWSGYTWNVRPYTTNAGPGPNTWNDTAENVTVQSNGDLRLGIIPVGTPTDWQCVEIDGPQLGYGQYVFTLATDATDWHPSLVLGLFVYDSAASPNYREIDFAEISKWNSAEERSRCWFTLQPTSETNQSECLLYRQQPMKITAIWQLNQIYFKAEDGNGRLLGEHLVPFGVPDPGNAKVIINFWMTGTKPTDTNRRFCTVKSFSFTASTTYTSPAASTRTGTFGQNTSPLGFTLGGESYLSDVDGLVLPCRNLKSTAWTGNIYPLSGSSVYCKISTVPPVGDGSNESRFFMYYDTNNYFQIGTLNGNLVMKKMDFGTLTSSSVTYNATNHLYWRIRDVGGNFFADTSPDATTWTNQWNTTHTLGSKLNEMRVRFECEHNSAQGDPGRMCVTKLNTA